MTSTDRQDGGNRAVETRDEADWGTSRNKVDTTALWTDAQVSSSERLTLGNPSDVVELGQALELPGFGLGAFESSSSWQGGRQVPMVLSLILSMAAPTAEGAFWSWFVVNADRVATIKHGNEPIANELAAQLARIDSDLTFEVGTSRRPCELIISAGGLKRAFSAVQRLVAAAPLISGWKVVAFRPRSTAGLIVEIGGYRVNPADVWFKTERDGQTCGVTIYLPGYRGDTNIKQAGYLLLDASLGEYDVEMRVGFIEFKPVPSNPVGAGLRPLSELPGVVDGLCH